MSEHTAQKVNQFSFFCLNQLVQLACGTMWREDTANHCLCGSEQPVSQKGLNWHAGLNIRRLLLALTRRGYALLLLLLKCVWWCP